MTKTEITKDIAKKTKLKVSDVRCVIDLFINAITDDLISDGSFNIKDFGTFKVIKLSKMKLRNVRTGVVMDVPERNTVKFKPSEYLKNTIQ